MTQNIETLPNLAGKDIAVSETLDRVIGASKSEKTPGGHAGHNGRSGLCTAPQPAWPPGIATINILSRLTMSVLSRSSADRVSPVSLSAAVAVSAVTTKGFFIGFHPSNQIGNPMGLFVSLLG